MQQKDIEKLLNWYQKSKRDLPWRQTTDSYKIWISEVMLQQTRVETVIDYYNRFIKVLPTIQDLANVKEDKLLKLWEGLGYYSRARNLKKCAEEVIQLGYSHLPEDENLLQQLPGLGPYTIGAILSIAYQQCVPAIDGNVLRVLSRVYEEKEDILKPSVRKKYTSLLKQWMPKDHTRDFTESFIELGALICTPKKIPLCEECPLKDCCQSRKHHTMLEYPKKKPKKDRKILSKTVLVLKYQEKYAISKRKSGVLKGMYELPNIDVSYQKEEVENFLQEKHWSWNSIQELGEYKHLFSHLEWHMKAYIIDLKEKPVKYSFYSKEKIISDYSLPTAFYQIFKKIK